MYGKFIFAAVLIAFVSVQLAYTLQCYECSSPSECRNPGRRTCDEKSGNLTTQNLKLFYRDVSNATNTNFECLFLNGTENNRNVMEIRGCVFQHINACALTPLPNHTTLARQECTRCSGNFCNGKNPAGTFSSSFYTLMASAVMVLIAKVFLF